MPPRKPFAEIGLLKVKTIGTGKDRVKVVLFPSHEYGIEHFLPGNWRFTKKFGPRRVALVKSLLGGKKAPRFILKRRDPDQTIPSIPITNEPRLARFANLLNVEGVKVEEPLAIILRPNGEHEVFFRRYRFRDPKIKHYSIYRKFREKLDEFNILIGGDAAMNWEPIGRNSIVVFDLEHWRGYGALHKRLSLKR